MASPTAWASDIGPWSDAMTELACAAPLLEIGDLTVSFVTDVGRVLANDSISLAIAQGETLGIVGESGSGKSVLCRAIMRLLPSPPASITAAPPISPPKFMATIETTDRRLLGST